MKRYFFASIFILAGLLFSRPVLAVEQIDNFDVEIKVNQDASINVNEKIEYDFGIAQKHGIFRNIPIEYKARGGNFNLRISDLNATDENGTPYAFTASYPGNDIEIKIGDADKLVTGKKTYVIHYAINRAINYFSDHDELYWNATGKYVLGLKEYLSVAEKDRIKFHNAPEKNPQHFEKLLPYAMVLGVEKKWAGQFQDMYTKNPSWYTDSSGANFNSIILINSLNNFSSSANSVLASRPSSAAGGGFGGGGGGSW